MDTPALPPLPTFLIVGAQKSATRWLRSNLALHPEVFAADFEVGFFNSGTRFYDFGPDWYRTQFEGWSGEPIVGEATPGYMIRRHMPGAVARRIQETVPDVRLIAVLRNPIDRARSALLHHIRWERIPPDTDLVAFAASREPDEDPLGIVTGSWYEAALRPFAQRFGDQLLVVLHDDVKSDPRAVYRRALEHIGASPDFVPPAIDDVVFSNERARSSRRQRDLTVEDRTTLYEYFRADVLRLERLVGHPLPAWKTRRVGPAVAPDRERQAVVLLDRACDWIRELLAEAAADDWGAATPCTGWDVCALVGHLIDFDHSVTRALRAEADAPAVPGSGTDLAHAYDVAADNVVRALIGVNGTDIVTFDSSDVLVGFVAGLAVVEQAVHGWDLATALGRDATMPADVLEFAARFAHRLLAIAPRDERRFAPETSIDPSAPASDRLAAFLGRTPVALPVT